MRGRVSTEELKRLVYNSRIYGVKSSSVLGCTLWIGGAGTVRVVSTDDYISLVDYISCDSLGNPEYRLMDHDFLEALGKSLESNTDEWFDLASLEWVVQGEIQEVLDSMDATIFEVDRYDTTPLAGFAISPQRLTKLRLVKPTGQPIDIKAFRSPQGPVEEVIGFRIGTVQGVIAPLDRDHLRAIGKGEGLWD